MSGSQTQYQTGHKEEEIIRPNARQPLTKNTVSTLVKGVILIVEFSIKKLIIQARKLSLLKTFSQ